MFCIIGFIAATLYGIIALGMIALPFVLYFLDKTKYNLVTLVVHCTVLGLIVLFAFRVKQYFFVVTTTVESRAHGMDVEKVCFFFVVEE